MARERKVWPRAQVAHLWANASQDEAREPSGHFWFTGPALYSYGSHYVVGYRYERADGTPLFIMRADGYSSTTSKHQSAAWQAVPRYNESVWLDGLKADTFGNLNWRAKLLRVALVQAGEFYDQAAAVTRLSMKRDGLVTQARDRETAARQLALAFIADKTEPKAARAALRMLAKVAAVPWPANDATRKELNDGERAAARACAAILVRDEMRDKLASHVESALSWYKRATDPAQRLTYARRDDYARNALNAMEHAQATAKQYRFKLPRFPDILGFLAYNAEPLAIELRADALASMRDSLQSAESFAHECAGDAWTLGRIIRDAEEVKDSARTLANYGGDAPAWMLERAAHLGARAKRRQRMEVADSDLSRISRGFADGFELASGGEWRAALRELGGAVKLLENCRRTLESAPTHPRMRQLAAFEPDRERAAPILADAEARIAEENAAKVAAWRRGEGSRSMYDVPGIMLRVSGDSIETSHGAIVPVSAAPRLWRLIERVRGTDTGAQFAGLHVGPFTLSTIRPDGSAVVGCHDLAYSEMRACAESLGLVQP